MYGCLYGNNTSTCSYVVCDDDPIGTYENIRIVDFIEALGSWLDAVLCCSGELNNEDLSLSTSTVR